MSVTIVSNQVKCLNCQDVIFSGSVHDYRECRCGAVAVDGGGAYLRRVGEIPAILDMSIILPTKAIDAAIEEMDRMKETGRNTRGILYGALRALRDNGVKFSEPS